MMMSFPDPLVSLHLLRLYLLQAQSIVAMPSGSTVWTQLLTALVVGLLTAFAFQLLVTSLGLAIGISVLALRSTESDRSTDEPLPQNTSSPDSSSPDIKATAAEIDSEPEQSSHISTMAGFGILFTVNLVLFAACFLAAKFSQADSSVTGAIEGIVIWSAYFLLLIWISTTTVSSLIGSVLGATVGGFRRIVSTLTTALSSSENESMTEKQMIAAIREEMQTALDEVNLQQMIEEQLQTLAQTNLPQLQSEPVSLANNEYTPVTEVWQELETYLLNTNSKSLTPKRVDRKLQKLLEKVPSDIPSQALLLQFDRDALTQLLDQRDDITDKKSARVIDQIEVTWKQISKEYFSEQLLESSNSESDHSEYQSSDYTQSDIPQTLSRATTRILKSIPGTTLKHTLTNLPELLQRLQTTVPNWQEVSPIVLPAILAKLRDSQPSTDDSTDDSPSAANLSVLEQTLNYLIEHSPSASDLNHSLMQQVEHLQSRSMQQVESIQQAAQDRIEQVKQQARNRLDNARKAAATAAWWLFLTASTAALSSALAGALATGWNLTQVL